MATKRPIRVFSPDGTISLYFPLERREDGNPHLTLQKKETLEAVIPTEKASSTDLPSKN